MGPASGDVPNAESENRGELENLRCRRSSIRGSKKEPQVARYHHNSNVSKILPLTTLRTIDLGGRRISGPLFSGFCAELRDFFDVFSAPKSVQ
jgi:hypothetical protein